MWRYGLLSTPAWGTILFFLLPFTYALVCYLVAVGLACWFYDWLVVQQ